MSGADFLAILPLLILAAAAVIMMMLIAVKRSHTLPASFCAIALAAASH
jgi:hypothetical protein